MIEQSLAGLMQGFGVALVPNHLMWSLFGVLVGNLVGVIPGMGTMSTISVLLPLTFGMQPVPAILMLAGVFYGSTYGGAISAILLNLPSHAPHAVACLDGYPLTKQGKGGKALGLAMFASFFATIFGILVMIFASPLLVAIAFKFGPADIFSVMLLGLLAGSTMARGSPLKGVAAVLLGLLCGVVGTDVNSGIVRFSLGTSELWEGVSLISLALGMFAVGDFLLNVNRTTYVAHSAAVSVRDMLPNWGDIKKSLSPILRGTIIGTLFGAMPGTGPTITSFIGYAFERKISKTPERFGHGAIEGVVASEAASHAKAQVDFIPTMCLGIPGDPIMALILGALMIQGITPGPQLITEHPDLFWGLIASFWVGNALLLLLNIPMIGIWVKVLRVPYRYLFPAAMFFVAIGVYSHDNNLYHIAEVLVIGAISAILVALQFPLAPILLGFVLGPMVEENFRRALTLSNGDLATFVERPISTVFVAVSALLLVVQTVSYVRGTRSKLGVSMP